MNAPPRGVYPQPDIGAQLSPVQALPSSQSTAAPRHVPPAHCTFAVQAS